jgi:chromosome segregation protein
MTRTRERIDVLSELEQRLEGLDNGVQQVLRMAEDAPDGPLGGVRGVVADLFHVDVDTAPLIEVALGERAQFVVVAAGGPLFSGLGRESLNVADRVGFLFLDAFTPTTALDRIDLADEPGVMGRADRFIETAPQFAQLVRRLLGRTWLVDRLATAVRLALGAGRHLEFVTSDGELLAADGSLVVGPRSAVIGILSRRSELRACHEQIGEMEQQLAQQQIAQTRLQCECARQEETATATRARLAELTEQLMERRQQTTAARARLDQVQRDRERNSLQLQRIEETLVALRAAFDTATDEQSTATNGVVQLEAELKSFGELYAAAESHLAERRSIATEKHVAAARCEERVEMLRLQMEQITHDQLEKDRVLAEARQRLATREAQHAELETTMLQGRQALAELFVRKEHHAVELAGEAAAEESLRNERSELNAQIREARKQLTAIESQRHKLESAADRLRHERQTLHERMQEDYGINLAEAGREEQGAASGELGDESNDLLADDSVDRDAIEREIAELRNQINTIGAVNIDALEELEEIESRFKSLSSQYRDLVDAKASLERIIQRINIDSKQLFVTTLEIVRGHFQELFRRLFGGGEADIVLEDQADVLECGIDIIARPPGKEACSISLLSGGEKTLTCVALLLAVFRSKPSPFCILDEVDAALDEANIGRFADVLRDFLSFTQFIVVTHSKKTMSGGDTMYGVTMEESGVSKRVAVRFEDVSEDGQIRIAQRRAA